MFCPECGNQCFQRTDPARVYECVHCDCYWEKVDGGYYVMVST